MAGFMTPLVHFAERWSIELVENIKNSVMKHKRVSIACVTIYVAFLIFSFYNDLHFFDFSYGEQGSYFRTSGNPNAAAFYCVLKVIFIIVTSLFLFFLSKCWIGLMEQNISVKKRLKIYGIIFIVYSVILIHIYPGIWWCNGADEYTLLSFVRRLQIQYHQGPLSSIMFFLALMCYPKPAMVVLFQIIIATIVLGEIIYDFSVTYQKGKIGLFILIFSPASLYFAMYPIRAFLFAVFFLAFIHYYLKFCKKPNNKLLFQLTAVLCMIVNYRTEAKFLLLLYPFLLIKKCKSKRIIQMEIIVIASVFLISALNVLGYQRCNMSHKYLMLAAPLSMFLADEDRDKTGLEQDLQNIDKVYDISYMQEHAHYSLAQKERLDTTYTKDDLNLFLKSSLKIIANNPDLYLKAKILCAMDSLGLRKSYSIKWRLPEEIKPQEIAVYFNDVDKETHDLFGQIVAGQYNYGSLSAYQIFYAFWLPCIMLFVIFAMGMKKELPLMFASGVVIIQLLLTIFTAPGRYQMYYYIEYLAGWYLVIYTYTKYGHWKTNRSKEKLLYCRNGEK